MRGEKRKEKKRKDSSDRSGVRGRERARGYQMDVVSDWGDGR